MSQNSTLIYGIPNIARYCNLTPRQLRHVMETQNFPIFYLNTVPCSTSDRIQQWIAERAEQASRFAVEQPVDQAQGVEA